MRIKETIHICRTNCWHCNEKMNAIYIKREMIADNKKKQSILSPNGVYSNLKEKAKEIAKENDVYVEDHFYGDDYYGEVITANMCPHCGKPFGNSHIKELVGKEIKEIIVKDDQ